MKKRRRQLLKSLGITSAIGIAGCSQRPEPDNKDKSSSTEDSIDTDEQNSTDNENTSDDSDNEEQRDAEEKNNCCKYPKSGVFNIVMEDGPLGPDGVFDQGGEEETLRIPLTEEEFIEEFHTNQIEEVAKEPVIEDEELFRKLPTMFDDEEWMTENVYSRVEEKTDLDYWGDDGPKHPFNSDQYKDEEKSFKQRFTQSNYNETYLHAARTLIDQGVSSLNDYIKTAVIAKSEAELAGRTENITTNTKTNDDTHGLGWMMENVSWDPEEGDQNVKVYIIETDQGRDHGNLVEGSEYPDNVVFTEQMDVNSAEYAWVMIGSATEKDDYNAFNIEIEEMDEFVQALNNPSEYAFKPIIYSSILMEYLNDHAVEDGNHPELEGYNYTIKPVSGEIAFH